MIAYINAHIFTSNNVLLDHAVVVDGLLIKEIVPTTSLDEAIPRVDLKGSYLAPSFIDLQVYGGLGQLFSNKRTVDAIQKTFEQHQKTGTSHFQITLNCSPWESILEALEAYRAYQASGGQGLLGLHLEGPFFNPIKKGAHIEENIVLPTMAYLEKLVEVCTGVPIYMTIAPEMFTEACLDFLQKSPFILSIGHSNASLAEANKAFDRGIQRVTHLYNAMSPFQSREVGLVGATFARNDVWASIIVDGFHCDYTAVRLAKKMKGKNLFLITDAVTEDTEGTYKFTYRNGRFEDEKGTLSGSALSMIDAVKNCVIHVGIPLDEALRMASTYPAEVVGIGQKLGKIQKGYDASMVVFNNNWEINGMITGETFWRE